MQDKDRKRRCLIEIGNENMSLWHKHGDNFSTVKVHIKVGICRTLHIIFFIFLCLYFFNSFFDLRFHLSLAVTFQLLYLYVILNLIYFIFILPYLFKFNLIIQAKFHDKKISLYEKLYLTVQYVLFRSYKRKYITLFS